ncbi:hypothetical protein PFISCL1PPCAC_2392 [Pristionchus fissidentatus]|uniref:Uncharacterized protein n=1 Tax=Pristionchus fissidentatus TaxID=1538716 RepID=A0AAV5UY06_9BILA|nr:hypothetical protein PFISCL1PPCAC_2392 [Pristionchus fissidentatus]
MLNRNLGILNRFLLFIDGFDEWSFESQCSIRREETLEFCERRSLGYSNYSREVEVARVVLMFSLNTKGVLLCSCVHLHFVRFELGHIEFQLELLCSILSDDEGRKLREIER